MASPSPQSIVRRSLALRVAACTLYAVGALLASRAEAVEKITLTVERIKTRLESRAGSTELALAKARVDLRLDPRTGLPSGRLRIETTPLGALDLPIELRSHGSSQQLAGGPLHLPAESMLDFGRRYLSLPEDVTAKGGLDLIFEIAADGGAGFPGGAAFNIAGTGIGFSNDAGTVAAEGVDVTAGLSLQSLADGVAFKADLESASGEALLGSAYLRFATYPTRLSSSGTLRDDRLELTSFEVTQQNLLQASGKLRLRLPATTATTATASGLQVEAATVELRELLVPAAYATYLQTALAGTALDSLETAGQLSGSLEIRDSAAVAGTLRLDAITLRDARGIFFIHGLRGGINWAAEGAATAEPSSLAWDSGGTYDLSGGAASVRLLLRDREVTLLEPARLPVFDGAIDVRDLQIRDLGLPSVQFRFAGGLEPISLRELSRAFGWPEFAGVVKGSIPGVEYHDGTLRVDGDLQAEIFDGRIRGSNIRLGDPFGRWPRLTADLALENLDLEAITSAFEFGTITGRIEGRVDRLELFDWKPVTFDAWLRTPAGDHSRKHISVDAINSIANIGGTAGTGVATALRGGALRFFSRYHYRQLAIRCILDDDICQLSGAPLTGDRYYLLEGAGIPRVNIIGNTGRVQWSELVDQIAWQIRTGGTFRIE
ncbi:MAG: hypothetical protein KJS95_07870 [Gammaproteobacteria bacterium]|nr:hypothetical protein [Gammaproteobacteria bacterium]